MNPNPNLNPNPNPNLNPNPNPNPNPQATAPRVRTLGHFATKVEAAVCYAKWVEEQERCEQP